VKQTNDGGPAFPVITTGETMTTGPWASAPGMTLRDYFAAAALTGLLASDPESTLRPDSAARSALRYADAMLAARGGAS